MYRATASPLVYMEQIVSFLDGGQEFVRQGLKLGTVEEESTKHIKG